MDSDQWEIHFRVINNAEEKHLDQKWDSVCLEDSKGNSIEVEWEKPNREGKADTRGLDEEVSVDW